jgi:hypothetical protein
LIRTFLPLVEHRKNCDGITQNTIGQEKRTARNLQKTAITFAAHATEIQEFKKKTRSTIDFFDNPVGRLGISEGNVRRNRLEVCPG